MFAAIIDNESFRNRKHSSSIMIDNSPRRQRVCSTYDNRRINMQPDDKIVRDEFLRTRLNNTNFNEDDRIFDSLKCTKGLTIKQRLRDQGKKTLILDLDETLVHSMNEIPLNLKYPVHQIQWRDPISQSLEVAYTSIRPGVTEFLSKVTKLYEVVIFTASMPLYAHQVLKLLDTNQYNFPLLSRSDCILEGDIFIKDLSVINRSLKNIIIVDNFPKSYKNNPENGIPISSWYDEPEDKELYKLLTILEHLSKVSDVRTLIPKFIINDRVSLYTLLSLLNEKLSANSTKIYKILDKFKELKNSSNSEKQKLQEENQVFRSHTIDIYEENQNYENINETNKIDKFYSTIPKSKFDYLQEKIWLEKTEFKAMSETSYKIDEADHPIKLKPKSVKILQKEFSSKPFENQEGKRFSLKPQDRSPLLERRRFRYRICEEDMSLDIDEEIYESPFQLCTFKLQNQEELMFSEEKVILDTNCSFEEGGVEEIVCS